MVVCASLRCDINEVPSAFGSRERRRRRLQRPSIGLVADLGRGKELRSNTARRRVSQEEFEGFLFVTYGVKKRFWMTIQFELAMNSENVDFTLLDPNIVATPS